jgi:hypothetical protein
MGNSWQYKKLNFKVFRDRADFIQQGKEAFDDTLPMISDRANWYRGSIDFGDLAAYENEQLYQNQQALKDFTDTFDQIIAKIDMGGVFKKSKLKITDDKRGVMDFGLVSKGLFRRQEYFSYELAKDSPDEFNTAEYNFKPSGIVPFEFVEEDIIGNEKFFWYTGTTGKKYQMTKQQEGTRAIELNLLDAKLKFSSTTKKAYVMYEKKGGKAKMVELFIPVNLGITFSTVLPLFMAAKFFQLYGVMTKISIVRMYKERSSEYVAWGYPIKDYGDEMDFNYMALNGVDKRWWSAIKAVVLAMNKKKLIEETYNSNGKQKVDAKDFSFSGQGGLPESKQSYVELISRFRNFYLDEIKAGRVKPLRTDKKLLISGVDERFYSKADISIEDATLVFFRIVDTVDFQFNKPEDACKRIYQRTVTDALDKYYAEDVSKEKDINRRESLMKNKKITLTSEFKTYVQNILFDTYDYPIGGMYAEDPEDAKKLDDELEEKVEKVNQFISSL